MSKPTSVYNPPVFPLEPICPPAQTVVGYLNETGIDTPNPSPMNGQPPSQDFWLTRQEYIGALSMRTSQLPGVQLGAIDVLLSGSDNFFRRSIISGSQFAKPVVTITLWAIKPPACGGKIRIEYRPEVILNTPSFGVRNNFMYDSSSIPIPFDSYQRSYIWEWDLAKQRTFTIQIDGNSPIGLIPTTQGTIGKSTTSGFPQYTQNSGFPHFMTTYGALFVSVQNQYTPGSIFADSFNIHIFKSFAGSQFYVQTASKSGSEPMLR